MFGDAFPDTVALFYGYPSGNRWDFYNLVPPWIEELVSMRCFEMVPQGKHQMVGFAAASSPKVLSLLRDVAGLSLQDDDQILTFPDTIDIKTYGAARNDLVLQALKALDRPILMSQPFFDVPHHAFEPAVIIRLSDKIWVRDNMADADCFPEILATYESGAAFRAASLTGLPLPCVVKVSRSSSGDGVALCRTRGDVRRAKNRFGAVLGPVFVEEFVTIRDNIGVHYNVPKERGAPPRITWASRQITGGGGEFLSAVVGDSPEDIDPDLKNRIELHILEKQKALGFYGLGNYDVFRTGDGRWLISDPNPRFTGLTPFVWKKMQGRFKGFRIAPFTGVLEVKGDPAAFVHAFCREGHAGQLVTLAALSVNGSRLGINGGILFTDPSELKERVKILKKAGVRSDAFPVILKTLCSGVSFLGSFSAGKTFGSIS